MKASEKRLLQRAYDAEISGSLSGSPLNGIIQTKSKVAQKLVTDGYLDFVTLKVGSGPLQVTIKGFVLSHAGRLAYCMSAKP